MTDVIQQAREALAHKMERGGNTRDRLALQAVVEAADAGHLIDTRRLEHMMVDHGLEVFPTVSTRGKWTVYDVAEDEYLSFHATAAEAVAAAEREAQ